MGRACPVRGPCPDLPRRVRRHGRGRDPSGVRAGECCRIQLVASELLFEEAAPLDDLACTDGGLTMSSTPTLPKHAAYCRLARATARSSIAYRATRPISVPASPA